MEFVFGSINKNSFLSVLNQPSTEFTRHKPNGRHFRLSKQSDRTQFLMNENAYAFLLRYTIG